MRARDDQVQARALELVERARRAGEPPRPRGGEAAWLRDGGAGRPSDDGAASGSPVRRVGGRAALPRPAAPRDPWDAPSGAPGHWDAPSGAPGPSDPRSGPWGPGAGPDADEPVDGRRGPRRAFADAFDDEFAGGTASGDEADGPRSGRGGSRSAPPVVGLPAGVRGAVATVSWPAVAGLLVLLLVAAAVLGARVLTTRVAATPVAVTTPPAALPGGSGPSSGAPAPTGVAAGVPSSAGVPSARVEVVVDVAGAVRRPGVLRMPGGSRVVDALDRAGGTAPDADLTAVNRARPLVDGELLRVPRRGETPPPAAPGAATPGAGSGGSPATPPGSASGAASGAAGAAAGAAAGGGAPVDLNTADAAALDALPGIGPAIAGRIVEWRTAHGRFSTVDELGEVSGIGDKLLARLRPLVRV